MTTLPPRAHYLIEPLSVEEQCPLLFDPMMIDSLPDELRSLMGIIRSVTPVKQGGPSLVLLVEAEQGMFILKTARGDYRDQELRAEYTAMYLLQNSPVPVPKPLEYTRSGNITFLLREYVSGEPLSIEDDSKPDAIRQMGELLASIHAIDPASEWTWEDWIDASLEIASQNLAAGVCDPDEFTSDEPPDAALDWLLANRPAGGGSVCLLHGDYRPKNILWENGKITCIVDWQFVDFGDPYYDLSVINWYMQDRSEWQRFLDAYGLFNFDHKRFEYCLVLQKFLNV